MVKCSRCAREIAYKDFEAFYYVNANIVRACIHCWNTIVERDETERDILGNLQW